MNICVIPARGGSKRILRKNIKKFLGKPIIAYSIEAALGSNCFDQIIVSTDDEEIAEIAYDSDKFYDKMGYDPAEYKKGGRVGLKSGGLAIRGKGCEIK